jgi:hypothetical protein
MTLSFDHFRVVCVGLVSISRLKGYVASYNLTRRVGQTYNDHGTFNPCPRSIVRESLRLSYSPLRSFR